MDPYFEVSKLLGQHFVTAAVALYVHHKIHLKRNKGGVGVAQF